MKDFDFSEIKNLFGNYKNKFESTFSDTEKNLANELVNSLDDLSDVSKEIIDRTNDLFTAKGFTVNENNEIEFMGVKIKLNQADQNIPIQLDNATKAFPRSLPNPLTTEEDAKSEKKLARAASEYYRIAHRISHITESLPGLEKLGAKDIRIIRNQLIEHPEKESSGITYDSFSYSKNEGPFIKGLRVNGQTKHMDKGFKVNNDGFISEFKEILQKILGE